MKDEAPSLGVIRSTPWSQVPVAMLEHSSLSWKAKGILAYIIGRPPGWKVRLKDLVNRSTDGTDSVRSGLKELRANGYLRLTKIVDDKRLVIEWKLDADWEPVFPKKAEYDVLTMAEYISQSGNPNLDRPPLENPTLNKKDSNQIHLKDPVELLKMPATLDNPEFVETWEAWKTHRKEIRHKLTLSTATSQLRALEKVGSVHAIQTIHMSIEKGWQGLFPEQAGRQQGKKTMTSITTGKGASADWAKNLSKPPGNLVPIVPTNPVLP